MKRRVDNELEALIGEAVRDARKRYGLSQDDLADHLGVSYQQLQKNEHGKNRLSASRLLEISIHLNEPTDTLLSNARSWLTGNGNSGLDPNQSKEIWKLGSLLHSIHDPEVKKHLVALVKQYKLRETAAECAGCMEKQTVV